MIKEQKIHFLHKSTMRKENGEIEAYEIEVTGEPIEEAITLQVKPGHLTSNISMKRILLDRKIFYSASKNEHTKTIKRMFENSPCKI
ncbi:MULTISPECIES: hypothetical protein [unclassified Pseudomonas]|uniref:hypothetical protein n=1 Tax=unclassified Pseudomonas TaxID=196821 RepID=UPI0023B9EE31|nr:MULTISPECIES: hypothetical protein [unclassified Pseudomonas]